jgi:hypothetical protein
MSSSEPIYRLADGDRVGSIVFHARPRRCPLGVLADVTDHLTVSLSSPAAPDGDGEAPPTEHDLPTPLRQAVFLRNDVRLGPPLPTPLGPILAGTAHACRARVFEAPVESGDAAGEHIRGFTFSAAATWPLSPRTVRRRRAELRAILSGLDEAALADALCLGYLSFVFCQDRLRRLHFDRVLLVPGLDRDLAALFAAVVPPARHFNFFHQLFGRAAL